MKKILIIITALLLILTGCSTSDKNTDEFATSIADTVSKDVESTPVPENAEEETAEETEPVKVVEKVDPSSLPAGSLNAEMMKWDIPDDTTQVIFVVVEGGREKMYLMELHESGLWQVAYGPFEAEIGRNGLGKEKEGDGKSPIGVYELGYAFGRHGAPYGTIWPWRDTVAGDLWIEDSRSEYYNLFVKEAEIEEKDWKNGSNLNISAYERAIEVRYNEDRIPKLGSAIFIHCWKDSETSTSGCTAVSQKNMETLIRWMDPMQHTVLLQVPYDMLGGGDLEYMCDFDYTVQSDIKLASEENFFNESLPGYNDNTIITTTELTHKMLEINELLEPYDRKLYIYDAYRPMEAYEYINTWTASGEDTELKELYYPGYTTSELTKEYFTIKKMALYPRAQVIHAGLTDLEGNVLDMGGEYFIFDEFANYENTDISAEAEYNRELLHDIMLNAGFTLETDTWWGYTYNPNPYGTKYDEIIE